MKFFDKIKNYINYEIKYKYKYLYLIDQLMKLYS